MYWFSLPRLSPILAALVLCATGFSAALDPVADRRPVLVELYTSEGCSSCPPADRLLERLATTQPVSGAEIIPLAFHVDYWNRLGWTDPYSSSEYTDRQRWYAGALGSRQIYTPQMIVGGREGFVGSDAAAAKKAIALAANRPAGTVLVEARFVETRGLHVEAGIRDLPPQVAQGQLLVLVAITQDGLSTDVPAGENKGRTLDHHAVVRWLGVIGDIQPGSAALSRKTTINWNPAWDRGRSEVVVFVQDPRTGEVPAVGRQAVPSLAVQAPNPGIEQDGP